MSKNLNKTIPDSSGKIQLTKNTIDQFKKTDSDKVQNPIDWLINEHFGGIENCTPEFRVKIEQARAIHREQIEKCSIETTQSCYQSIMDYLNEPLIYTEEDLENQKQEAKQYYEQTFL